MMTQAALPGDRRWADPRATSRERRRFTRAALISGLCHALLLALLIGLWAPIPEETQAPIPVTLRAGDGAPGAAGGGTSETAAAAAAAGASESPSPTQTAQAQTPPAETAAAQPVPTPTTAPPKQALVSETEPPPPPPTETAEPVPPRKPTPPRPPQPAAVQTPTPPTEQTASSPTPVAPATPAPGTTSTAMAGGDAVTQEGAGGRGRGDEGAGRAAIGNGSPNGLGDDYLEKAKRWLARYQKMPDEAAQKKQYGTALVTIVIDHSGNVLDTWIDQSSGYPLLDAATLKMVRDASPLPKVPDTFKGAQLKFGLPANYKPGLFERMFH